MCTQFTHFVHIVSECTQILENVYIMCTLLHACRWLDEHDALRSQGVQEHKVAPEPRTHVESYRQGQESENYIGPDNAHPKLDHGINGWCILGLLALFDIIWDICPDMMHILKNFFERVFIALPAGERIPNIQATFNVPKRTRNDTAETYQGKMIHYQNEVERHAEATRRAAACTYSKVSRQQVDIRIRKLAAAPASNIPFTMVPFKTLPGERKQKCVAWVTLLRFYLPYVVYGVGQLPFRLALLQITEALRAVLLGSCDYDKHDEGTSEDARTRCQILKNRLVLALCELERILPGSELSIYLHEVVHVADFMYRWNNVRNYWCFITERFVGYVKKFVKNRHLELENLVRAQIVHIMPTFT
jgi:hypothetical protein